MDAPGPPSVLVVDDEDDIRHNLADILGEFGYRVATAPDGPSALELVRARPHDVALLDYKMPGMTGLELYREIMLARPETVAILVSAYTDARTRGEAMAAGMWRVLPKPVDLPRLLALVVEALERPLVLVVDDDPDLRAGLWDVLREWGYRVCLAGDVGEASGRLGERAYEVLLVDLRLPDGDGAAVLRAARAAAVGRAVLITGHRPPSPLLEAALLEGADAVCYKPLDMPRLLEELARLTR